MHWPSLAQVPPLEQPNVWQSAFISQESPKIAGSPQEHFPVDAFRASLPSRELNISIGLEMVRSVRAERKVVKAPIWYKNIFFNRHSSRAALRLTISAAHSMV